MDYLVWRNWEATLQISTNKCQDTVFPKGESVSWPRLGGIRSSKPRPEMTLLRTRKTLTYNMKYLINENTMQSLKNKKSNQDR